MQTNTSFVTSAQSTTANSGSELAQSTSANVVQNDNSALATAHASSSVRNHFEQLAVEREAWESTVYRTNNEQLYVLLQKCYQTYQAMSGGEDEAGNLRKGLADYIKTKGYQFKSGVMPEDLKIELKKNSLLTVILFSQTKTFYF